MRDPANRTESTPGYSQPKQQLSNFLTFLNALVETTDEWHLGFGLPEILIVRKGGADCQEVYGRQDRFPGCWVRGTKCGIQNNGDGCEEAEGNLRKVNTELSLLLSIQVQDHRRRKR